MTSALLNTTYAYALKSDKELFLRGMPAVGAAQLNSQLTGKVIRGTSVLLRRTHCYDDHTHTRAG
jgi:hypothetical protein